MSSPQVLLILAVAAVFVSPPFGPIHPPDKVPTPIKPKGKPAPIVPSKTPKPKCEAMNVQLPVLRPGVFLLTNGDTDVRDQHRLEAKVRVWPTRRRLHIYADLKVHGFQGGTTDYARHHHQVVDVNLPAGCQIASLGSDKGEIKQTRSGHSFTKAFGTGLVDYATCRTDTNGEDVDKIRCKEIVLRTVSVELEPVESSCPSYAQLRPPKLTLPAADHVGGDKEMGGNVVNLSVDASLHVRGTRLEIDTTLTMEESVPDHTTFSGTARVPLLDTAKDFPGCKVSAVGLSQGRLRHHVPADQHDGYEVQGSSPQRGLLYRALCRSDSDGQDAGKLGCGTIQFSRFYVWFEPT